MKTPDTSRDRRAGAALFTVILILMVVGTLLAVTCRASLQRVFMARKLADRVRALSIAEAGANYAYSMLRTNFAARLITNATEVAYGGGHFNVTIMPVSNTIAVVTSRGTYGSSSEEVIVDVRNYGTANATAIDSNVLNYAILCGGNFDFGGCGSYTSAVGSALLHANGTVRIRGNASMNLDVRSSTSIDISNNLVVDGNVRAPVVTYAPSKVTISGGATVTAVPYVTIPDLDLSSYYNRAQTNGQVFTGNITLTSSTTPAGGVLWVNGTLTLAGNNCTHTGTYIATSALNVTGDGAINNPNSFPTLICRDGDINFGGQKSVNGLIYVKSGNYKQTGGNTHTGQLIVRGNIEKGGNSDVLVYNRSTIIPPDGSGAATDIIGVSAWQK